MNILTSKDFKYEEQLIKAVKLSRENLLAFSKFIRPQMVIAPHHILICNFAERLAKTHHPDGLQFGMIDVPPRHGKSFLISQSLPAFLIGNVPMGESIMASYSMDLSLQFGGVVKQLIREPRYQLIFPGVLPTDDSSSAAKWSTTNKHTIKCTAPASSVTGFGAGTADLQSTWRSGLICDDLLKNRAEALSKAITRRLHGSLSNDLLTRLLPNAFALIMGTRWSTNDPQGYLQKAQPDKWAKLSIPAICDNPETDPLNRELGEALWPEWFSLEKLSDIRGVMTSADWASLYQGQPIAKGGNLFTVDMLSNRWNEDWQPYNFEYRFLALDTASKLSQQNDFSFCTIWGLRDSKLYLLDAWQKRLTMPELVRTVFASAIKIQADAIACEDASSGTGLLQILAEQKTGMLIQGISARGEQYSKVQACLPFFEEGKIVFPSQAQIASRADSAFPQLINELISYPSGENDDGVLSVRTAIEFAKQMNLLSKTFIAIKSASSQSFGVQSRRNRANTYGS